MSSYVVMNDGERERMTGWQMKLVWVLCVHKRTRLEENKVARGWDREGGKKSMGIVGWGDV